MTGLELLAPALAAVVALAAVRASGVRARARRRAAEPAAPPTPVPLGRVRRSAPARELAAAPAEAGIARTVLVQTEIAHVDGVLRLRVLGADPGVPLGDAGLALPVAPEELARRGAEASRAHALLCDRLAQAGWEPCGRGLTWYANRFRRTLPLPT